MKKSLISAVKKLLAKLGAEEIEGNNLVEVIDNGAEAIEGGGSGGGGAVTLYFAYDESTDTFSKAYKDIAMTKDFSSNDEAMATLTAATVVKLCLVDLGDITGVYTVVWISTLYDPVVCGVYNPTGDSISTVLVAVHSNGGGK